MYWFVAAVNKTEPNLNPSLAAIPQLATRRYRCVGGSSGVFACHSVSCSEPAASENSGMTLSQQIVKIFFFLIRPKLQSHRAAEAISDENCSPHNALQQSMFGWSPAVQSSHLCLPFLDVPQFVFALLLLLRLHLGDSVLSQHWMLIDPNRLETYCVYQWNRK